MDIKPFENKVWLSSPTMHGDELKYITEAYETNWMSTVGENINEVERQMAEKIGCGYAVALSCGTSALHLAMKLAGIKPGDEVLCSDMTFDATVNPVVYEGGGGGRAACGLRLRGPQAARAHAAGRRARHLRRYHGAPARPGLQARDATRGRPEGLCQVV